MHLPKKESNIDNDKLKTQLSPNYLEHTSNILTQFVKLLRDRRRLHLLTEFAARIGLVVIFCGENPHPLPQASNC